MFLPLLGGEGRGEGERGSISHHLGQAIPLETAENREASAAWFRLNRGLESPRHPPTGMSALRSAGFPACGFPGLSSPGWVRSVKPIHEQGQAGLDWGLENSPQTPNPIPPNPLNHSSGRWRCGGGVRQISGVPARGSSARRLRAHRSCRWPRLSPSGFSRRRCRSPFPRATGR